MEKIVAKRVITKIGDVFSAKLENNKKKYFQYIANDMTQLNSDVIRAFEKQYDQEEHPNVEEVITDQPAFYAHTMINVGVKLGLWGKIGKSNDVGDITKIIFRDTNDAGRKLGDEPVLISERWYIWKINDDDFTRVGKLTGENRNAEIGVVVSPKQILTRLKTGKYNSVYPGYE